MDLQEPAKGELGGLGVDLAGTIDFCGETALCQSFVRRLEALPFQLALVAEDPIVNAVR